MGQENSDVIVAGAGVNGLSAAFNLVLGGSDVLVLEQFDLLHERGQSYGKSRQQSFAYDSFKRIKLAIQSNVLRENFERVSGEKLFFRTGGLDIFDDEKKRAILVETREAMKSFGIDYEEWDYRALRNKLPVWHLPETAYALYSPEDGILHPARTVSAYLKQAIRFGARVRDNEPIIKISSDGVEVEVITTKNRYRAKNLVIACGVWTNKLLANLGVSLPIQPSLAQTDYFEPKTKASAFFHKAFPMWYHHREPVAYGFPIFGERGIKIGFHWEGLDIDLDRYDPTPRPEVDDDLRSYLEQYLPDAAGRSFGSRTCLYDNTVPDKKFIVGWVPGFPNVFVLAGFSGRGFNPALAIGKATADLMGRGQTEIEISEYSIDRFFK